MPGPHLHPARAHLVASDCCSAASALCLAPADSAPRLLRAARAAPVNRSSSSATDMPARRSWAVGQRM